MNVTIDPITGLPQFVEQDVRVYGRGGGVMGGSSIASTDDLPEGTTNLYSQWTTINEANVDNITPTNGQRLLIGSQVNSTYFDTSYTDASAVFDGTTTGGANYFMNLAYGSSFVSVGGTFIGGRARGTAAAPTQAVANDMLMTVTAGARDNVGNWVLHNDGTNILSGIVFRTLEDVASGDFNMDITIGSVLTEHLTVEYRGATGNAVVINNSLLDTDFEVNWDSGTAFFVDGGTGQVQIADGSVGTPALAFINDPDTGLHYVATNQFSLTAGGVSRVQISALQTVVNPAKNASGDFIVHGDTVDSLIQTDASADSLSFFNTSAVTQRTGDIKTGLNQLGLFSSTAFVSEHRFLVTNAI